MMCDLPALGTGRSTIFRGVISCSQSASHGDTRMRLLPALLLVLFAPALRAQEVTASIVGVVVDGSGLAIPNAAVSVRSLDRNDVLRKITTDSQGEFVATLLPIGRYSVKAERDGFKTAVRDGIELHVNDKLALRLELQVGQV